MYERYFTITIPVQEQICRPHIRGRRRRRHIPSVLACILASLPAVCGTVFLLFFTAPAECTSISNTPTQTVETAKPEQPHVYASALYYENQNEDTYEEPVGIDMSVPEEETGQKTFMDYRAITSPTSRQYALQQNAQTNDLGLRTLNGAYMVAMGTYYGDVGDLFEITLETGSCFRVIMGDVKADIDTDETNRHRNGNLLEFIVDGDRLSSEVWKTGDISYADPYFSGKIQSITKLI